MLRSPAEFPHAGCQAYLATPAPATIEPVRIVRHNRDGTALIAAIKTRSNPIAHVEASGNRTVPFEQLHATEQAASAALTPPKRTRRRRKATA